MGTTAVANAGAHATGVDGTVLLSETSGLRTTVVDEFSLLATTAVVNAGAHAAKNTTDRPLRLVCGITTSSFSAVLLSACSNFTK